MKLGGRTKKRIRASGTKWQLAGLGALAALTVGVVGYTLIPPAPAQSAPAVRVSATPTTAPALAVAVIGDSYAAGTGAGDSARGWVATLARNQAWKLTNLARGGTGYSTAVTTNAQKACALDYCPAYGEMIGDAVAAKPSMVIVAGGRNDSRVPALEEAEAIRGFYAELRTQLPEAKIVAFNPMWDASPAPAPLAEMSDVVAESVTSVGGVYLDAGQPLASPGMVAADGVHPNAAGHAAIFEAQLILMQQAGLAVR